MIMLSDGTVVAVGDSRGPGEIGAEFFHGKASCNGFETLVGDTIFMPGVYASPETAVKSAEIPVTQESSVKGSIWNSLTELYYKLRWIALAILVPLILYFLLKNGIQWIRNKYPDGILTKPITASIPHRAFFSSIRIVIYSLVLLIVVPILFNYLAFSLNNMQEDCESSPASDENNVTRSQQISTCVKKKSGIFSKLFKQANNPSPSLPCRYVGVWATSRKGDSDRTTLQADGKYIFEESTQGGYRAPEYGHWEVQSDNIVWYHRGMESHPDVNKILNQTDTSFTLVEENGMHTNFELIEPLKTGACAK